MSENHTKVTKFGELTAKMRKQIEEAEFLISQREAKKVERESVRVERNALFIEKGNIEEEISLLQEKVDCERRSIVEHENARLVIDARKESNDRLEAEKIIPVRSELLELKEEKEKLDSFLGNISTEFSTENEHLHESICANKEIIIQVEKELNGVLKDIDEKKSVIAEQRRILDDHVDATKKELGALELRKHEQIQQNLELELKIAGKSFEIKKREDEREHEYLEIKRKFDVLRHGQKLLQKAASKERSIMTNRPDESSVCNKSKKKSVSSDM